jgi:hypothetical protein
VIEDGAMDSAAVGDCHFSRANRHRDLAGEEKFAQPEGMGEVA